MQHYGERFISICTSIGCPVLEEKTEYATPVIIFLGILLDGKNHLMAVPNDKRIKAISTLQRVISKKKITIKEVQKLTGLLNFLQRAIVPGRTFTQRMYDKLKLVDNKGNPLKHYHHIRIDPNFKLDCKIWLEFLNCSGHELINLCRPFLDQDVFANAHQLDFYSDASLNRKFGFGAVFGNRWIQGLWGEWFIDDESPSIEFL